MKVKLTKIPEIVYTYALFHKIWMYIAESPLEENYEA
jgi:hypothetical protein